MEQASSIFLSLNCTSVSDKGKSTDSQWHRCSVFHDQIFMFSSLLDRWSLHALILFMNELKVKHGVIIAILSLPWWKIGNYLTYFTALLEMTYWFFKSFEIF